MAERSEIQEAMRRLDERKEAVFGELGAGVMHDDPTGDELRRVFAGLDLDYGELMEASEMATRVFLEVVAMQGPLVDLTRLSGAFFRDAFLIGLLVADGRDRG